MAENEQWFFGGPADVAFVSSLMQRRGIPVRLLNRYFWGGAGFAIPGSRVAEARALLKEIERQENIREFTPEEYAQNQRLFVICLILSASVLVPLSVWIMRHSRSF